MQNIARKVVDNMTNKIVIIAYHSDQDSDVKAVMQARGILISQMTSNTILERFEIFDVVDSVKEKI